MPIFWGPPCKYTYECSRSTAERYVRFVSNASLARLIRDQIKAVFGQLTALATVSSESRQARAVPGDDVTERRRAATATVLAAVEAVSTDGTAVSTRSAEFTGRASAASRLTITRRVRLACAVTLTHRSKFSFRTLTYTEHATKSNSRCHTAASYEFASDSRLDRLR